MEYEERIALRDQLFTFLSNQSIIIPFKNSYKITRKNKLESLLNTDSNFNQLYNQYINQFRSKEEALYCLTHHTDFTEHVCPICGEILRFWNINRTWCYAKTCGKKECAQQIIHSDSAKQKCKETFLEHYGVDNPAKCKEVIEKMKTTNMERYGKEYIVETDFFKEKSANTCMERYGVPYATQSEEVQQKAIATNLERYGRERFLQGREIHDVIEKTNIERYGCKYPMQNQEILQRAIDTNMERLGVPYPMQSDKVKENYRKAYHQNNYPNAVNTDDINKILEKFENVSIDSIYANNKYFSECIKFLYKLKNRELRLKEIAELFGVMASTIRYRINNLNLVQYFYIRDVSLEVQFKELLDKNNISYFRRDRSVIGPEEIDFLLETYKIGIEINDLNSHNVKNKDVNYHINKVIRAANSGVHLIHIWEWELTNKILWNRLSNWIINLLNLSKTRIYARKCNIRTVSINIERDFLRSYHLQGYRKSEVCLGLYYKGELIQLMSFCKSRYNSNYEWELLRLCTKYGYTSVGGANKLLKHFIKTYNPSSLISYCDLSKFTGKVYTDMGFKLIKRNQPSATWYNEETENYFLHSSLVKKGADKLLGTNFGKGTNNEQIAIQNGYRKVYNCGMNVYGLKFK